MDKYTIIMDGKPVGTIETPETKRRRGCLWLIILVPVAWLMVYGAVKLVVWVINSY